MFVPFIARWDTMSNDELEIAVLDLNDEILKNEGDLIILHFYIIPSSNYAVLLNLNI